MQHSESQDPCIPYYPSAFSSVDIVVAFSPKDDPDYHESYAAYYRRQVEGLGEVSVLVGEVLNNQVGGLSLESEWQGMGVGRMLVNACLELAHQENVLEVMAITANDAFFRACGFDFTMTGEKKALFYQTSES